MKIITSEVIVDLVKRRFKPIDSNWESDALDIISEGISSIKEHGLIMGHELYWETLTVKDNKVKVPQIAESLEFIIYEGELLNKSIARDAVNPEAVTVSDRTSTDAVETLGILTIRYEELEAMILNETDVDVILSLRETQQEVLDEILEVSKILVSNPIVAPTGDEFYFEQGHYITTSFETGDILVYYRKYFTDENGYPMIIDTFKYRQAMYFYFIGELLMQGYENKNITYKDAFALHEEFAQKAANQSNTWGVEENEQFAKMSVRMKQNYNLGKSNFRGL